MKIKQIFIKDFGIFNNQRMDDIGPGLVIIGGLNRAGKTTFLQLLRHIAFGFPRKKDFITARKKHEVEAIVTLDNREEMAIHIQGHGEPIISSVKGDKQVASVTELYNSLDPFTYQQLFTITLDELQSNLNNNVDKERLQSILLGAGLQEFVLLPQLEDYFNKEAEKIGGKNGDPKVREFKPYYTQIEEGLNIRTQASKQVDRYNIQQEELKKVQELIKEYNNKVDKLDKEINRLDILKNNYQNYSKVIEIQSRISTSEARKYFESSFYPDKAKDLLYRYNEKEEQVNSQNLYLKEKLGIDKIKKFKDKCLKYQEKINIIKQSLSGIKERIRQYHEVEGNIALDEDNLKLSINKINGDWNGNISNLNNIKTDHIELVSLQGFIDKYNKILSTLETEKERLLEYKERKIYLEESLQSLEIRDPKKRLRFYFISSFICIVLGYVLSYIHIYLSMFGITGFLGIIIYLFYKYTLEKGYLTYREKSYSELSNLEHKINTCRKKIKSYSELISPLEEKLNRYKGTLGLTTDASPELIKDYFREIQQAKEKLFTIEQKKLRLKRDYNQIENELEELYNILKKFPEVLSINRVDENNDLYIQDELLFSMLQQIFEYIEIVSKLSIYENELIDFQKDLKKLYKLSGLELGEFDREIPIYIEEYLEHTRSKQNYQNLLGEKEQLIQQIKAVLNTELVRNAMRNYPENDDNEKKKTIDDLYRCFIHLYEKFLSLESVETRYYNSREQMENSLIQLKEFMERKQIIQKELDDLSTDKKLKKGSNMINQARQDLSYLAEDYAINKTAAFILKKVRETFIQKTKDKLLAGASQYFRKITGGEYKAILPAERIKKGDFQALLKDGTIQESTNILSRGTNEQLFLAIRISRIKEIEPALPVIVDDSFVNFDSQHLVETIGLLKELSKTHQVFILTCHPNLIEICKDDMPIQYWQLEKGQFNKTDSVNLISYLKADK